MNNEYWLTKWGNNDIAFHEKEASIELINFTKELHLKPGDTIFVPLCGKTKDMLWFANQSFHVIGVELSQIACQDFFKEWNTIPVITKNNKFEKYKYGNIELICGDLFDLTSSDLPSVKAVYDCKALIALPSTLRKKYLDHILQCVGSNIKILLMTRESPCNVSPP